MKDIVEGKRFYDIVSNKYNELKYLIKELEESKLKQFKNKQ
ncbi:hypothetical protein [Clostridium neonatale]|uniref:Uncharacterized protein n=1 Tax=Clostridium neonatale TaxID=137838 RepID=A0AA86MJX9_9CLOT|nr:hypothetical protein [Clostridium neonatale]CAG9701499.1 hypothetical protein CNEO_10033 [Clostridium neonatale]CAG9714298.1 hypothetical protein CNEO_2330002 [Clostridium neonatale]CAI3193571.1 hypothetical protein CNEO2_1280001 [Clostridium neonatale]CAI3195015.1 hypothetical protein CNEO2_1320012 [Clostridium neonatale]CAI3199894.1 hypothetical protein CNEO2_1840013 [Clostridium neonatale]